MAKPAAHHYPLARITPRRWATTGHSRCSDQRKDAAMTHDDPIRTGLEAAVFRRLVEDLRVRTGVTNVDWMNLAGSCRKRLSNRRNADPDGPGVRSTQN